MSNNLFLTYDRDSKLGSKCFVLATTTILGNSRELFKVNFANLLVLLATFFKIKTSYFVAARDLRAPTMTKSLLERLFELKT